MLVGVISDTHGRLAPDTLVALRGVAHILHAGDIGDPAIIAALESVAPVTAVRGNSDAGTALARRYPVMHWLVWEGVKVYMTHIGGKPHDLAKGLPREPDVRPDVYIFGHSHTALIETIDGVLFLNPGAAGQPRFGGGLSLAILELRAGSAAARIVPLKG